MHTNGWVAGIIDGEGYVGIEKNRGVVRVDNTDFRIVEKLKDEWDGSLFEYKRKDRPRSKRIWRWVITGWATVKFLETIGPLLISKGDRANAIIELYKTKMG